MMFGGKRFREQLATFKATLHQRMSDPIWDKCRHFWNDEAVSAFAKELKHEGDWESDPYDGYDYYREVNKFLEERFVPALARLASHPAPTAEEYEPLWAAWTKKNTVDYSDLSVGKDELRRRLDSLLRGGQESYKMDHVDYCQKYVDIIAPALGLKSPVLMDLPRLPLSIGADAGPSITGGGNRYYYYLSTGREAPLDLAAWQADAAEALAAWNATVAARRRTRPALEGPRAVRERPASPISDPATRPDPLDEPRMDAIQNIILDPNTLPGERQAALEAYGRLKSKGATGTN